jgi:L-fuconolactonase
MSKRIIDIHPHIISQDTSRYPIAPLGGKRSEWSITRPVDFAGLVAQTDAAGVHKAAIVHSSTTYGYDNSYLADAIAGHGARFTGVFSVDVRAADAATQIRHWVGRGLTGLRLFAAGSTVKSGQEWIADPATYPSWNCCQEMQLPVAISMRQEGLPHLFHILSRFPRVRVVMDHLLLSPIEDGPPYRDSAGLFSLAKYPNVFLKITTNNIRRCRAGLATPETFFGKLVEDFGAARLAWGSNFPNERGTLAEQLQEARSALSFLPEAVQDGIFSRTAITLYPSLADSLEN